MSKEQAKLFKEEIFQIIYNNFGAKMASIYREFYQDEDPKVVASIAKDMLAELIGNEKAEEKMKQIINKFNLEIS
ncbi:hypothetical protein HYS91_04185 [Candidatus Daviesbacteria bacterium]|nr:hypothetical protein [Candidatus Daviesbacteria bacterium]